MRINSSTPYLRQFVLFSFLVLSFSQNARAQDQDSLSDTLQYRIIDIRDSARAFSSDPEPLARVQNTLPVFEGDSTAEWMNRQIRAILKMDPDTDLETAVHESQKAYLEDYTAVMEDFQNDDSAPMSLNYENSSDISVSYNDNGYLMACNAIHDYSGGAHGMHGLAYYPFDVKDQKAMVLEDVVDIDSTTLQSLLEQRFREQYDFQPDQPLKDLLFDEELKANDNFFFNRQGLGFCYVPYEVAPYAAGVIEIVIPYERLSAYLQPAFAYRMEIDKVSATDPETEPDSLQQPTDR